MSGAKIEQEHDVIRHCVSLTNHSFTNQSTRRLKVSVVKYSTRILLLIAADISPPPFAVVERYAKKRPANLCPRCANRRGREIVIFFCLFLLLSSVVNFRFG